MRYTLFGSTIDVRPKGSVEWFDIAIITFKHILGGIGSQWTFKAEGNKTGDGYVISFERYFIEVGRNGMEKYKYLIGCIGLIIASSVLKAFFLIPFLLPEKENAPIWWPEWLYCTTLKQILFWIHYRK